MKPSRSSFLSNQFPFLAEMDDAFLRTARDQCAVGAQGSRVSFVKTVRFEGAFAFILRSFKATEGTRKNLSLR